jgi:hypothetical protein
MTNAPLGREILEYLVRKPEAKDTLQGIVDWWLSSTRSNSKRDEVRDVLEELVERKWVKVTETRTRTVYGLDIDRLGEVKEFLRKEGKP